MGGSKRSSHDKAATRSHLEAYLESYPGLRGRVCRVLLLHLHTMGLARIEEIYRRAERAEEWHLPTDPNVPSAQLWAADEKEVINNTVIDLAAEHLSPSEVDNIVWAAHQRDEAKSVEALARMPDVPLDLIAHKVSQYASIASAGKASSLPPTPEGTLVALIRRFICESVDYISVAKRYLDIHDISWVLERTISTERGSGWVGGKAAGMLLAWSILRSKGFDVELPNTVFLLTDVYTAFKEHNGLTELADHKYQPLEEIRANFRAIRAVFRNAEFPPRLANRLRAELARWGEVPLIVRSSSLLEDSFGAAFAGIYQSLFLGNNGSPDLRLRQLLGAIAEVYSGVFSPDATSYRRRHDLIDHDERMAVMIQPVVGTQYGEHFFPPVAGVAFSRNDYRWNRRIRREDGLLRLVLGLGTHAVDRVGDYARMVPLGAPTVRPEIHAEDICSASQKRVDALNLQGGAFCHISTAEALHAMRDEGIADYVSVVEMGGHLSAPVGRRVTAPAERLCLTFDGLLSRGEFPDRMRSILSTLEEAYRVPIDLEFAVNQDRLHVLQCRPLGGQEEMARHPVPAGIPPTDKVFSADRWVNNGLVEGIDYVVLVDPRDYARLESVDLRVEVARVVGRLNDALANKAFILMGPGRWGRQDIRLGVRVGFGDLSNARALVEIAREAKGYTPEPSFGTHFFQEIVEASILYLPVYPDEPDVVFNEDILHGCPNALTDIVPAPEELHDVVRVIDVAGNFPDQHMDLVLDGEMQEALCFLH